MMAEHISEPHPLPRGHQRRIRRERTNTVLGIFGAGCITAGLLILAFALFQFFGTSLITRGHQTVLHDQFSKRLSQAHITPSARTLGPARSVPATTQAAIGQPVAEISIPKINIDFTVLQGTGDTQLEAGPGHYLGTPLPGQLGNAAIAGHRTTWLRPFWNLNELSPGDQIFITTTQGYFRYTVTSQIIVAPTDVAVLDPSTNATLTLSTCNPRFSASQRLIAKAVLSASWLPSDTAPVTSTSMPSATTQPARQFTSTGSWVPALVWGSITAAIAWAAWWLRRRLHRRWIYLAALPLFVVALFLFFLAVSPLLPASI
jgi:sortase A